LCYGDISFGNVFFDPQTGEIQICDNDNVTIDRVGDASVLGTPDFMAPELVRGEASPSTQTDLFSLAVLLFYLFHIHHPLFGRKILGIRCLDLPARTKLCGNEPLFIFNPTDKSNAALSLDEDPSGEAGANALLYWPIFPQFLRDMFVRAFTEGISDPINGRVRESEWRIAMNNLEDSIYYCGSSGAENFYDIEASGRQAKCWNVQSSKILSIPPTIKIGRREIMLNHDTKLYSRHIDHIQPCDSNKPIAELTHHPDRPQIWGLKNTSQSSWNTIATDGTMREVVPGQSVAIAQGLRICFGQVEGQIISHSTSFLSSTN
jgi:serine/threonine protein kinase